MTQIAQPQVSPVSVLHGHRTLVLTVLGALIVLTTALIVVIGNDGSGPSIATSAPRSVGFAGGRAAGDPSAVARALALARVPHGVSLTTNVPAAPRVDEGPVAGTPSAVSAAIHRANPAPPSSLTTKVRTKTAPTSDTPAAIHDANAGP